jgi:hypothetical protein
MTKEARQEIRRVLMGGTVPAQDGRLTALEKGQYRMPIGITDGAGAACFFGICKKARRLKASCPEPKAKLLAAQVMRDVGRELVLPQQPEAVACLIRYVLTRPAVLVFDYRDGVPVLTAWTGRGLTGWISLRRALKAFLKRLPKQLSVSEKAVPLDEEEARKKERREIEKEARASLKKKKKKADPTETANTTEEQANESES